MQDEQQQRVFVNYLCLCLQQIQCKEVLLEDMDISKALIDCISMHSIELLVLGAPSRGGIVR